ncbi:MAG: DUF4173 domain-containing protein [Dehalococcoidia bacterium]
MLAWLCGGLLRGVARRDGIAAGPCRLRPRCVGAWWKLAIVLGLVNLLFAVFVVVQFRYFFGGAALVERTLGLTYATYARRGFFELVTVAALTLPLLLGGHWLLRRDSAAPERVFRALAAVMVALLAVIIVSAIQRMRLYMAEFGLTELRLYTTAFMLWLTAVLGWFCLTVLTGRRDRFSAGAVVAGLVAAVALMALDPHGAIVRVNVARAEEGRRVDAAYTASLSADAVPSLVEALPRLAPADRCIVVRSLLRRRGELDGADWRLWSLARYAATRSLRDHADQLDTTGCPPVGRSG